MLTAISIFSIQLLCCGCIGTAAFGSRAELYDPNVVQKLGYIHVMPVSIAMEQGERTSLPDSLLLTRMLAKEVASRALFTVIPSDTVLLRRSPEIIREEMRKVFSSGVVLFAHMIYTRSGFGEPNATLMLKLADPSTGKVLAFSSHDTFTGSSYILKPSYEDVTADAIKGAVDALEKSLKKSK